MTNAERIKALRCCASPDMACKGLCPYHGVEYCSSKKDLDAADALEAADKRIAELEADKKTLINVVKDKSDFRATKDAMRIADLEARLSKIKSQIYDLENMAKREYDDDRDNEYLEGYFDGLHQAAKLTSTVTDCHTLEEDER